MDKKPYGEPLSPTEQSKAQVNLSSGKHECYLQVTPKDKSDETYASNVLVRSNSHLESISTVNV